MLLEKVRLALRRTGYDLDEEIQDLIDAALADLGIAGVDGERVAEDNPLIIRAVCTYAKVHSGDLTLKASYDEQKAQLQTATGYGLE